MSSRNNQVTGYILAGGQGSRMGGADKGLLSLHGRPLVEHVIERIAPQVDQLRIIANRNQATYEGYGFPVLADIQPDFAGPLIGMLTALMDCETDYALFTPVDAAALPQSLFAELSAALKDQAAQCAVASDAKGWQPLCSLIPVSALTELMAAITAGERSPKRWLEDQSAVGVSFAEDEYAWSVNTAQELATLQARPELAA